MTGAQALSLVRFLIAETTESYYTDTNLLICLNGVLNRWAAALNSSSNQYYITSDTLSLSANSQSVSVPSDFANKVYMIINDSDNSYTPLQPMPFSEYDLNSSGTPHKFCIAKDTVYFDSHPTSAMTYTIYYLKTPTEIADSSTVVDFPIMHHLLLVYDAVSIAMQRDSRDISQILQVRQELVSSFYFDFFRNVTGGKLVQPSGFPADFTGD